ncbi:helicase [Paenibacillus sp. CAA11]|uniref:DNA repair helicase XPB n=1 Tax=Paenibacillus sp. CAA11 TaxID=1532905 RepID=UPI000D382A40|nr:DNA repair helicase XPB [Paenibacillus sp. CAA11]AWB45180.1 helicase [Paenibacillus sp. CAA11]
MNEHGACIVQNDLTLLLETAHPSFEEARDRISGFAELVKSPASFHTYRITPLSLWNAAAAGVNAQEVILRLQQVSRWDIPLQVKDHISLWMSRYGRLVLYASAAGKGCLELKASDPQILDEIGGFKVLRNYGWRRLDPSTAEIAGEYRGILKMELTRLGYPVLDKAGYHSGSSLKLSLRTTTRKGTPFGLRDYQSDSIRSFIGESKNPGGSGVMVMPCGAGKTVIGLGSIAELQCETLILTSNVTSVRQWIQEILDKTSLDEELIGEYSGERKQVLPVTVSTYQMLTHRSRKDEGFHHLPLLNSRDWGLIIYDEVHLLPAPVFRATADIQATRRLGLTATLVREDGREQDVFSLIGPKCCDLPWKDLESQGWIARVKCTEIRVPMNPSLREKYYYADERSKTRLAAENPAKLAEVSRLLKQHSGQQILIIGQYVSQLKALSIGLGVPVLTGQTSQEERAMLYTRFREGAIPVLIVSKVANFAVDLPDASVAIEVSGSFGSRQEEAQRLGRILRPKQGRNEAHFYTLVTDSSKERDYAEHRQLFLLERGYEYSIEYAEQEASTLSLSEDEVAEG